MEEEKEVGKKVEHTPTKVEMANGSGRVRCSCGWESLMQDDGFMWTQKEDVPAGFTQDATGDWQKHVVEARGQEELRKRAPTKSLQPQTPEDPNVDWWTPAHPVETALTVNLGVSKLTWLAGMIASGAAANPVTWDQAWGLNPEVASIIVSSAVNLAKALDEVEAEG